MFLETLWQSFMKSPRNFSIIYGDSILYAFDAISQSIAKLSSSFVTLLIVALVLFIIFLFLQTMAEWRLAKTDDLKEALNVLESAKDITRIDVGKVILLIMTLVIVIVTEIIISFIFNYLPFLSILSIIITPYLLFFTQRAIGLLYSDIG